MYTSESLALAQLEKLVQYHDRTQIPDQVAGVLEVPDDIKPRIVDPASLPRGWRSALSPPTALRVLGDAWLRSGATLLLQVPSAVSPSEWNLLVNPLHPHFRRCRRRKPVRFTFDPRIR